MHTQEEVGRYCLGLDVLLIDFLANRIAAAHAAFTPLGALASARAAPLAEIREVAKSTLCYGAMFTFLAPESAVQFDELQLEFERRLLGAPPWCSTTLVRDAAG